MKLRYFTIISLLFSFALFTNATPIVESVKNIVNKTVVIDTEKDLHITATTAAMVNSTVDLTTENAWLFFDNIKPSKVLEEYGDMILINGKSLIANKNARVSIFAHGTVIIPHDPDFQPLEAFSEADYQGESAKYNLNNYYKAVPSKDYLDKPLGTMNDKIRSFKLKRGYMATLSNNQDGAEYSRVFIADKEDINISQVQDELDQSVSFIRVMRWEWPSKKGWAGWTVREFHWMDATWFYTWGAGEKSTINSEFVPERHSLSWPGFQETGAVTNVTHLLGLNEPDHAEQANAMVGETVAECPKMLATGLRIGSPATTDFNWLYDFMDRCKALNYRIDYVVIHAYWGGLSPQQWYNSLKEVHRRTGRPLWIKEWNNGANWTHETWPDGVEAQQQKQLRDLKGILQVMDTASFIERYSIYNWVEDKRAMILPDSTITPAGIYYRDNKSVMAYNPKYEVVPVWTPLNPVLETNFKKLDNSIELSWKDINGGLVKRYIVERQFENEEYKMIAEINDRNISTYVDKDGLLNKGQISYRVKSMTKTNKSFISNVSTYYSALGSENMQYGTMSLSNAEWMTCLFQQGFSANPTVVSGVISYNNSISLPMTQGIDLLSNTSFSFRLAPWLYLNNPVINRPENVPFLSLPSGKYQWGNIQVQANLAEFINGSWKKINFPEPFDTIPVVFANQITNRSKIPTSVNIKNVTKTGFEIQIIKEAGETKAVSRENASYIAATPGIGNYGNKRIIVGVTDENTVGGIYNTVKLTFEDPFVKPALFATMQTTNDDIVSTLRCNRLWPDQAIIFKSRETSKSSSQTTVAKETVGWMVLETDVETSVNSIKNQRIGSDWKIYPNPVVDILNVKSDLNTTTKLSVYDMLGKKIMGNLTGNKIDVSELQKGFYILQINNSENLRFFKK